MYTSFQKGGILQKILQRTVWMLRCIHSQKQLVQWAVYVTVEFCACMLSDWLGCNFCTEYVQPNGRGTYTMLNQLNLVWVRLIQQLTHSSNRMGHGRSYHTLNCTKLAHWDLFKGHGSVKSLFITLPCRNSLISLRWRLTVEWAICSESVMLMLVSHLLPYL